ncbi:hypothetical protein SynBIOSE41_00315 [Synechococcus sp. BIOS-E4-1]|nr:hypothetical protein SynBIOSE41_00315 [Synechococcus sp. BIOS-E4-1]
MHYFAVVEVSKGPISFVCLSPIAMLACDLAGVCYQSLLPL